MAKFMGKYYKDLLHLLQLSVLFMVDELIDDIIDIIVLFWLKPENVIDIWLLTKELNVKVLRDICLSVCLERFEELPLCSLVLLSQDDMTSLLYNVNIIASTEYLQYIRREWLHRHMPYSNIPNVEEERKPRFIQATVVYKTSKCVNIDACLYTWNGTNFSKFLDLKNKLILDRWMTGMQVTGRGFSIYTVGGEMGIGTGRFNNYVLRYCLLSKKWYYHAKLPVPRRHMVVAFLNNQLVIVGGVGKHRLKLFTVDILDIHRGTWSKGKEIPESFIEVPYHCVMDDKLFIIKSALYIYCPKEDCWTTILIHQRPGLLKNGACLAYNSMMFIDGEHMGETILSKIDVVKDADCGKEDCLEQNSNHHTITDTEILYENNCYQFRYGQVVDTGLVIVSNRCNENYRYLRVYTDLRPDLEFAIVSQVECFNFIDPDTLYKTV
ncbi:uncharacterized protein LOC144475940 isoform X2 [Augochlora pura]